MAGPRDGPVVVPASSRVSVAPALSGQPAVPAQARPVAVAPQQPSLFPHQRDPSLRVVKRRFDPSPSNALRPPAGERGQVQFRREAQQRFTFPSQTGGIESLQHALFSNAPVAVPMHRLIASALDASMILISVGIFLIIFHFAAVQVVLNKATLPYYALAALAMLILYRSLWCLAGTDTIGMRWVGLRLITFDGDEPESRQRLIRFAACTISVVSGGLGLLWALVDEEKLAWHDHMSRTFPTPYRVR
ncbi:MAG: RDD family protein [Acidobacteria bacterium]|nr:RDD family protein [Acidobacteriota bacterium]